MAQHSDEHHFTASHLIILESTSDISAVQSRAGYVFQLPVSGALQLNSSGAMRERPVISQISAYCRGNSEMRIREEWSGVE